MAVTGTIEVRLTEADIEELLEILRIEAQVEGESMDGPDREYLHRLNNLMNKLSLSLQRARATR